MALPVSIEGLIRNKVVENTRIEYKAGWNPEKIMHTVCAFANDIDNWGGGYIVIGIEARNGMPERVVGLAEDQLDNIGNDLIDLCNKLQPRYLPVAENTVYDGKHIYVVWVPGGDERPYKCPISLSANKKETAYYIRKTGNTIRANNTEEKELFTVSESIPFDDRANMAADIEDLQPGLMTNYLFNVGSDLYEPSGRMTTAALAESMKLVKGPPEMIKPLNVGLMFFNDRPDSFFSYARIDVIDKPDPTGEGMTEKIFVGPLDRQLRDALTYIQNYVIKEKIFKKENRAEAVRIFNYPYQAVEEALSNAVYHKSYQIGEPITVMVTPDKMEITSLPGPSRTITADDLRNRVLTSRTYRNRRIGDFLKELKLVEGRNTGIPTMIKAMKENGSEMPIFQTDPERTYFTTILPVHPCFVPDAAHALFFGRKESERRNVRERIAEIVRDRGPLSLKELSILLGNPEVPSALRQTVREMIKSGDIEYTQPESRRSPTQKLRTKQN